MAESVFKKVRAVSGVGVAIALLGVVPIAVVASPAAAAVTINVNSTGDAGDANPGNGTCATTTGTCTVRAAVEEANALDGMDTVNVPAGTYAITGRIEITDSLFLTGAGASTTTLDGGNDHSLLHVRTAEVLVCDSSNDRIWSYRDNGRRNGSVISSGAGGLDIPNSLTIGPDDDTGGPGDLFVTGFSSGVHRFDGRTGANEGLFVAPGSGGLLGPTSAVFGPSNSGRLLSDSLFVTKFQPGGGILRYHRDTGAFLGQFVAAGSGGLAFPNSLAFRDGNLYVTSAGTHQVLRYDGTTGAFVNTFVSAFSGGLSTPRDLLFAPDGSLLVASWDSDAVLRYNGTTGAFLGALVPSGSGGLDRPTDLSIADGTLYVVSSATRQVLKYDLATGAPQGALATGTTTTTSLASPSCAVPRSSTGSGPIVHISGFTLANGRTATGDAGSALRTDPGSSSSLSNSVVRDNQSSTFGGGISNWGQLDIRRTEVRDNRLPEGGGGQTSQGGGVFNVGRLTIDRSTLTGNFATRGGAISNTNDGRVDITNSTISGNRALGGGGGIRNVANGHMNIASTTITLNRANDGLASGEPNRFGGGIQSISPARVSIGGSIVAGNVDNRSRLDPDYAPDCYAPTDFTFTSERSNLVGILTPNCALRDVIFGAPPTSDETGTPTAPLDARLGSLANNGGPTRTHAPLADSPAVDGKSSGTSSDFFNCASIDQRGHARPTDGNGDGTAVCDIGAVERMGVTGTATMAVTSSSTTPFSMTTVAGSGFLPGETVRTTFGPTIVNTTATAGGTFTRGISVPNVAPQTLQVVSLGLTSARKATFHFYVNGFYPWGSPSSWFVRNGDVITFSGNGFAPAENVNVEIGGVVQATVAADSAGNFANRGSYSVTSATPRPTFTVTLRGLTSGAVATFVVSAET